MLERARSRAKRRGIPFNLTTLDFHIPSRCPILDIPLRPSEGAASDNSPSLDRIDSTKGYVKGNVHVISNLANRIKNNGDPNQIIRVGTYMLELMGELKNESTEK